MPVSVSRRRSFSDRPPAGEPGCTTVSALVSSVSSSAICTTGWSGSPCSTYQVMSRAASHMYSLAAREPEEPAELVGVASLGGGAEHPGFELVVELVAASLERADLGGERAVVEQQRRVREPDRRLREVLQLDQDVDRSVELGERGALVVGRQRHRRRARELPELVHALLGAADQQHVADGDHVVGPGVELASRGRCGSP